MRVSPNLYASVDTAMSSSEAALQQAMNQLSSGKRVSLPSDDALAFAQSLQSLAISSQVDTYTKSANAVGQRASLTDAALSSVVTLLTQALSLGVQGGSSSLTPDQRSSLSAQVASIRNSVLGQANSHMGQDALFSGTAGAVTPFALDPSSPDGVAYAGNSQQNQVRVGDALDVATGLPGDKVFTSADGNVFGSLQQLISTLQTGDVAGLGTATAAVSSAIAHIGQVRSSLGDEVSQLDQQTSFLSQETISLSTQQTSLTNIDTAAAATALSQAQTAHSAVLAMAAKVLPESLLNYLH